MPLALCAMGLMTLVFSGCKKSEEKKAMPSNSPEVYMKDPAFRAALDAKTKELRAIVKEREPLMRRMEELARARNKDLASLQKIPEWNELYKKVVALNEKYETLKKQQLKIVGDRIRPQGKEISK